jgi:hypothetical protein
MAKSMFPVVFMVLSAERTMKTTGNMLFAIAKSLPTKFRMIDNPVNPANPVTPVNFFIHE